MGGGSQERQMLQGTHGRPAGQHKGSETSSDPINPPTMALRVNNNRDREEDDEDDGSDGGGVCSALQGRGTVSIDYNQHLSPMQTMTLQKTMAKDTPTGRQAGRASG
jgi:hypothetical protein